MKLASFNLENLFDRPIAMNFADWEDGKPILNEFAKLAALLNKPVYTAANKKQIVASLKKLELDKSDEGSGYVRLRQNKGNLLKRPKNKPIEIVADGRDNWIGWIELKTEHVNETATRNTAQVVRDVNPDVIGVIEVDNRIALKRFNEDVLPLVGAMSYEHVMLIDGNDDRGIDVGFMSRPGFEIKSMCSHVDDRLNGSRLFSRDCPEYEIELPSGQRLLILVNHFKSKGYGDAQTSNERRRAQAQRVRELYDARIAAGVSMIAVIGDLNDHPAAGPLDPLLNNGSTLKDVSAHATFQSDGRPGTWESGTATKKLDYILLSPALFQKVTAAGVFRKGVWGGTNGTLWEHYKEMEDPIHAASDHAAIWVELNV